MSDEVTRLRRLRRVALKVRALGEVLRTQDDRRDSVLARGGLLCWRIARLCTGQLRAHPYEPFQRGPAWRETANDGVDVIVAGLVARHSARRVNCFQGQLALLGQTLDDMRALTLTPSLSDDLGRAQVHMRQLLSELSLRAQCERGLVPQTAAGKADARTEGGAAGSSYLAL